MKAEIKVKIFEEYNIKDLEKKVNRFVKGKDVKDVIFTTRNTYDPIVKIGFFSNKEIGQKVSHEWQVAKIIYFVKKVKREVLR